MAWLNERKIRVENLSYNVLLMVKDKEIKYYIMFEGFKIGFKLGDVIYDW